MTGKLQIERAFGQKTVTLYRVEQPLWLTTATIHEDGDLSITSGDADNEWSLSVPAGRKDFLLNALLQHVKPDFPDDADEDDRLLRGLPPDMRAIPTPMRISSVSCARPTMSRAQPHGWTCPETGALQNLIIVIGS